MSMSYYDDMYSPLDDMDEEEYYFYQQQARDDEWQWHEHEQSLQTDKPAPFDEAPDIRNEEYNYYDDIYEGL